MRDGEKSGVTEAAGFLFEAIPSALEGPILHKVVDGICTLLEGADLGDVGKESVEVLEEDRIWIKSPAERVG